MTRTIITNPRQKVSKNGLRYLLFDIYLTEGSDNFIVIENCSARRIANGSLSVRCNGVKFAKKTHDLIAEAVEKKWGEMAMTKAAFTVY